MRLAVYLNAAAQQRWSIAKNLYIATFSKRYKLNNAANPSGQQAAQGARLEVFGDSASPETG